MNSSPLGNLVFALLGLLLLAQCACNRSEQPTVNDAKPSRVLTQAQADESHQKMLAVLRDVEAKADSENLYFDTHRLEKDLEALQQAVDRDDLLAAMRANLELGLTTMRMGKTTEALRYYQDAYALFDRVNEETTVQLPPEAKESLLYSLGVASLRKAEDENCIHCRTGESCILPIRGTGVHKKREGSEAAKQYFEAALAINEYNAAAVWLLNIAAMTLGEYPEGVPEKFRIPKERFESQVEFPRFQNIAVHLGLDTLSHAGGVVADDFDGDNLIDIFVSDWNPRGQMRFFRNNGNGSFTDRTEQANLTGITGGLNTVQADYDNDGDLDILVLRGAWLEGQKGFYPNSLLRNDGDARFTDVTFAVGLGAKSFPTQTATWADYDNDGDLDCFIGNERNPCELFENDGNGFFKDVATEAGVTNNRFTKGSTWGDFDGDRYPDLYVSNLGQHNRFYHNNGDGTFTDIAIELGVTGPQKSFATWCWDHDNDGILDLFVGSYQVGVEYVGLDYLGADRQTESDCLYQGIVPGRFINVAQQQGLVRETQPMGCNFGDLDNDGFLDFYLGTGYPNNEGLMPNVMYRNNAGRSFSDVTFAGGFGHLQKGHGVAFADFDHDGDQDIFIEMGGAFAGDAFQNALFENPGFGCNWIKVKLIGSTSNHFGVGARIKVTVDDQAARRDIWRHVTHGSSFGANPLRQEIGLGKAAEIESLEVYWPTSDRTQVFRNIDVNQLIEIHEDQDEYRKIALTAVPFRIPATDRDTE